MCAMPFALRSPRPCGRAWPILTQTPWTARTDRRSIGSDCVAETVRPRSRVPSEAMRYGLGLWLHPSSDVCWKGAMPACPFGPSTTRLFAHVHGAVEHRGRDVADRPTPP